MRPWLSLTLGLLLVFSIAGLYLLVGYHWDTAFDLLPSLSALVGGDFERSIAWSSFLLFCTSALSVLVSAVGVLLLICTLRETAATNRSAIASAEAAREANRIMMLSHRPWLDFQVTEGERYQDTLMSRRMASADVVMTIRNHGKDPALNVFQTVRIVETNLPIELPDEHKEMFEAAKGRLSFPIYETVFPNVERTLHQGVGVQVIERVDPNRVEKHPLTLSYDRSRLQRSSRRRLLFWPNVFAKKG